MLITQNQKSKKLEGLCCVFLVYVFSLVALFLASTYFSKVYAHEYKSPDDFVSEYYNNLVMVSEEEIRSQLCVADDENVFNTLRVMLIQYKKLELDPKWLALNNVAKRSRHNPAAYMDVDAFSETLYSLARPTHDVVANKILVYYYTHNSRLIQHYKEAYQLAKSYDPSVYSIYYDKDFSEFTGRMVVRYDYKRTYLEDMGEFFNMMQIGGFDINIDYHDDYRVEFSFMDDDEENSGEFTIKGSNGDWHLTRSNNVAVGKKFHQKSFDVGFDRMYGFAKSKSKSDPHPPYAYVKLLTLRLMEESDGQN